MGTVYRVYKRDGRRYLAEAANAPPVGLGRRQRRALELLPIGASIAGEGWGEGLGETAPQRVADFALPPTLAEAVAIWREGGERPSAAAQALAILARLGEIDDDPYSLGWRVRFSLDAGRADDAVRDLECLLGAPERLVLGREPPGLLGLVASLGAESFAEVVPALSARVERLEMDHADARRLVERLPPERWPLAFLLHHLRREGQTEPQAGDEARRRLGDTDLEDETRRRLEDAMASAGAGGREHPARRWRPHPCYVRARNEISREHWPAEPPRHARRRSLRQLGSETLVWRWLEELLLDAEQLPEPMGWQREYALQDLAVGAAWCTTHDKLALGSTAFLLELDRQLLRTELHDRLLPRLRDLGAEVALLLEEASSWSVVHRGFASDDGPCVLWLLRVDEAFGLLHQRDGSWVWLLGDADEVFNSVPERWFAEVVELLG